MNHTRKHGELLDFPVSVEAYITFLSSPSLRTGSWTGHLGSPLQRASEVGRASFSGVIQGVHGGTGHAFGQVWHYIYLNPVRADIVKSAEVANYPWSSLLKFTFIPRPSWMESAIVLGEAGGFIRYGRSRKATVARVRDEPTVSGAMS